MNTKLTTVAEGTGGSYDEREYGARQVRGRENCRSSGMAGIFQRICQKNLHLTMLELA